MKIHVKVPATTANLGPGFDTLGLALNLWNEAEFASSDDNQIVINIKGEGEGRLPTNADNVVIAGVLQIYEHLGKSPGGLQINCLNRIPLGVGLGSSSAAVLVGMLGANALLGKPLSDKEVLKLAIDAEGHPDNIAPALLGGLVASIVHDGQVTSVKLPLLTNSKSIHATVVLPDIEFLTKQSRSVLPKQVDHKHAVNNISGAILVAEALRTGDLELLGIAMKDNLHEPYRLPLIPGAQAAMLAAREAGAAAVALSGAGPGLIAFSSNQSRDISVAMQKVFESNGLSARIFELEMSNKGAQVTSVKS
ncbi:MAG: homoserine kinase [Anaerolineae bacterium]|nr:homoserine kinase [Anaerolineae bacterium]